MFESIEGHPGLFTEKLTTPYGAMSPTKIDHTLKCLDPEKDREQFETLQTIRRNNLVHLPSTMYARRRMRHWLRS